GVVERDLVVFTDSNMPLEAATAVLTDAGHAVLRLELRDEAEVAAAATGAAALIVQWAHVGEAAFAALPTCRFVSRLGIGYDMVDVAAADRYGVAVANVPDYCIEEVASHTVALILSGVRDVQALDASVRAGRFAPALDAPLTRRPSATRVVVVGFGRIGRRVAASLAALGFSIIICDPFVEAPVVEAAGYLPLAIEDALDLADIVTLHLPLTAENHHLIDGPALARLPRHAYLVNTCRGGLIDELALARALGDGSLGGAGLDVFETEPLPADHPLRQTPNVVLTPHAAWYSPQSLEELPIRAAQNVVDFLAGRAVASIVNPGYRPAE
ncbi:MAG: C-terminal binding protein, partial [Gaiellales bacterium]